MHQGALDREITLQRLQQAGDEQRDDQADHRGRRHYAPVHRAGMLQPADGFDNDADDNRPQQEGIEEGDQNPDPVVAERPARAGRPLHLAERKDGEDQDDQVGHHVPGIAEQGETVRPEPSDHLDDQHGGRE